MKTYEGKEAELIERIQEHVEAKVTAARGLEIRDDASFAEEDCNADTAIYPFAFTVEGVELRGAFTNGDPIWEEENAEGFGQVMGEIEIEEAKFSN